MTRNPHEFIRFVAKHYRLLAAMCRESRRFASDAELEAFVRPFVEAEAGPAMIASRMKKLGIVSQSTGDWAPPPFLARFLAELEQRHALASPGVVRGWVEKLGGLLERLEALSAGGTPPGAEDRMEISALLDEVIDTLQTIAATVGSNCDRIGAEVSRYRAEEDARQMRFRLARLIDLHTGYLEPVLRLIDIGGDFYSVSDRIISCCDILGMRIAPTTDEQIMLSAETVARDVVWLRRGTLRRAHEAHRELGPLCEAATRESTIARGVNRALEAMGTGDWARLSLDRDLRVVSSPDSSLLNDGAADRFLIAARSHRDTPPPMLLADEPTAMDVPWTAASLREELEQTGEVSDLLDWICDRVGRDVPDTATGLLHDLIDAAPECLVASDSEHRQYQFSRIEVEARRWTWKGEPDA